MPTPVKSSEVLIATGKKHLTKAEIKHRQEAEKASLTGVAIKERPEVKLNYLAHKEFLRVNTLLKKIGKNDAIIEPIINRYCLLQAECIEFEQNKVKLVKQLTELSENDEINILERLKWQGALQKTIISIDKQLQTKRKMLLDIERENGMTIAAALRSIPKREAEKENPLLEALRGD